MPDLPLVLSALRQPHLERANLKGMSLKTASLLATASTKQFSELYALSNSPECLHWNPYWAAATLWPNPAFLPKIVSSSYVNQPLCLAAFEYPAQGDKSDANCVLLCPVWALRMHIQETA